ncbi:MAG: SRPBCC family protein [Nitrospiraceae bacterium]
MGSRATFPGLQGDPSQARSGERFELMQASWSPTARVAVGIASATLALHGTSRRDIPGAGAALFGVALVTRASSNLPMKRIVGVGAGRRAVEINKTMNIAAPIDQVFEFWSNYKEFPRYTVHVHDVREKGEGRSRWTVLGTGGLELSWNAVITSFIPNQELAWRTEPDSSVQHAGILKFMDNQDGTTTLHIRMSYNPPAGALGHGIATLFRTDPKTLIEEDLVRIKTVLENGKIPRDVQQPGASTSKAQPMLKAEQLE